MEKLRITVCCYFFRLCNHYNNNDLVYFFLHVLQFLRSFFDKLFAMFFFGLESGLGFVLVGGRDNQHIAGDNGIFVTKIIPDSPAHQDGTIGVGDRLLEVLNRPMQYTKTDPNFHSCIYALYMYIYTP